VLLPPVEGEVRDLFPTLLVADEVRAVVERLEVHNAFARVSLHVLFDQWLRNKVVSVLRGTLRLSGTTYLSNAVLLSTTLIVLQNVY